MGDANRNHKEILHMPQGDYHLKQTKENGNGIGEDVKNLPTA